MRAPFAPDDLRDLREVVFGVSVTSIEDYTRDVRAAGLTLRSRTVPANRASADVSPCERHVADYRSRLH